MEEKYTLDLAGTVSESIVDGKGIRYTVFVQGCPHHCPGCHNPQTHEFGVGTKRDIHEIFEEFNRDPLLKGITFSGGEPFCQPGPLAELGRLVHSLGKDVTTYTGFLYEDLVSKNDPEIDALLAQTDVLIDGPFIQDQKNLELLFRGSANQRLIDMKKTRDLGKVTLLDWE